MSEISIVRCDDYNILQVKNSVKKAIDFQGGISNFVSPGERVLLKVNLLMKRKPERVTTTHPSIVQALAELVIEAGGIPIIGDSPGGHHYFNKTTLEAVYETCGMKEVAEKTGAELNYNTEIVDVVYEEGMVIKKVKTIAAIFQVDKIINIPKIKTHMMTVYSGAVKNLFGIIPGRYKAEYHLRFEDTEDFSNLLIDLCLFSKPVLTVMDAVIGMEGYGPTNGNPKKVGLIICGTNPFELDVVASNIIGLKPEQVPTIRMSTKRKLCSNDINNINIVGEKLEDVLVDDFKKPTVQFSFNLYNIFMPKFISKRLNKFIKPSLKFDYNICKKCGVCEKSCPAKAIKIEAGKPQVDYNKCIRCFCCHELCNYGAISIRRPLFLKLLLK